MTDDDKGKLNSINKRTCYLFFRSIIIFSLIFTSSNNIKLDSYLPTKIYESNNLLYFFKKTM